jgi:hypothetical protein
MGTPTVSLPSRDPQKHPASDMHHIRNGGGGVINVRKKDDNRGKAMSWISSPKTYGIALGGVFVAMLFLNALTS